MACRPLSRCLTPSSGPLKTRTAPEALEHHWVCSPVPGRGEASRQEGSHCEIRTTATPGHQENKSVRSPPAPGDHISRSVQRPSFPSPNNARSKKTRVSVIKKKHEVHFVTDWPPNNDFPTFPRAKLALQV